MKLMVVGGGGREHALVKALRRNPLVTEIFVLPGNAGMSKDGTCVPIDAKDLPAIRDFALQNEIDFAVVGPDDPLALGCVDVLEAAGIPSFGPTAKAAMIESSKVFSKNLMKKYGIPTAEYRVFTDLDEALAYLEDAPLPTVIKADGLALGKGVVIAQTKDEARQAVRDMMEARIFGDSGSQIVIEEFLSGPEVSVLSFTDGQTIVPMVSSMDHKRIFDGDQGPNTGGMGTIAPNPFYTPEMAQRCMAEIFLPTVRAMRAEGRPFKGCLYFGLMLTKRGPVVIEYNCRFGDPETQVVLPLLETDLFTVMRCVTQGRLSELEVRFSPKSACCVVMASRGYPGPGKYESSPLTLPQTAPWEDIFVAGAKESEDGALLSAGGRVLGAVAVGDTLNEAIAKSYALVSRIGFETGYYRRDIGKKAAEKEN